jgi:hypothetical protein
MGILLLGIILGTNIFQTESPFSIDTQIIPNDVQIGEEMELRVTIKPLTHLKGDFQIQLVPESYQYINIKKTKEDNDELIPDKENGFYSYVINNITLEKGENRTYVFYVTADCPSSEAKWYIDIIVGYKLDLSNDFTDKLDERIYFTVKKEEEINNCCFTSIFSTIPLYCLFLKKGRKS